MARILGDDAGLPDVRRDGDSDKPHVLNPPDVADLFLKGVAR